MDRQIKLPGSSLILTEAAIRRLHPCAGPSNDHDEISRGIQTRSDADASEVPPSIHDYAGVFGII